MCFQDFLNQYSRTLIMGILNITPDSFYDGYKYLDSESLKDTLERVKPLWNDKIFPKIKRRSNVMIVAHGNSLRSIVMSIENLSPEEILAVEIPTGMPIHYQFEEGKYSRIS